MAYTPTEWKDHIVEHPNRYRVVDNGDGTVDILDEHGNIIQQGTPVNAANLNKMEQGIKNAHDAIAAHLNDKLQDGVHGLATTQDLTLYVDATNGDDDNDGLTPQTAFRTLQKAIDSLPQIVNHTVNINVAPGDYAENCVVFGFVGKGTIYLNGNSVLASTHKIEHLAINRCHVPVVVTGFEFTTTTNHGVVATYAEYVFLRRCRCVTPAGSESTGFNFSAARGRVDECEISNRHAAIVSQYTSTVNSNNNAGVGNTYGLVASHAGIISKSGSQPTGVILEYTEPGGFIIGTAHIVDMGTNANGTYVRWSNGLQVCYVEKDEGVRSVQPYENLYTPFEEGNPANFNWVFPAAFGSNPIVLGSTFRPSTNEPTYDGFISIRTVKPGNAMYRYIFVKGDFFTLRCFLVAIGRWK